MKPIFKFKRNLPFVVLEPINKELERLENLGVLSKAEYSYKVAPTVCEKELQHTPLHGFSTGLNDCLKPRTYPLPSPEEIFAKTNDEEFFLKARSIRRVPSDRSPWRMHKIVHHHCTQGLIKIKSTPAWY